MLERWDEGCLRLTLPGTPSVELEVSGPELSSGQVDRLEREVRRRVVDLSVPHLPR